MAIRLALSKLHAACALVLLAACGPLGPDDDQLSDVRVASVRIDPVTATPIVELVEQGDRGRKLGIWVGEFEAESIARAIEHQPSLRPNPHDLLKSVLDQIQGRVLRIVVTELRGSTYYAVIELELRGKSLTVDARPSDAIAVALRADAPVLVRDSLFQEAEIPDDGHSLEIHWSTQHGRESRVSAPF